MRRRRWQSVLLALELGVFTIAASLLVQPPEPKFRLGAVDVAFDRAEPLVLASVPSPSSRSSPTPKPKTVPKPSSKPKSNPPAELGLFGGLGAWVDLWDYELDPQDSVSEMRKHGVRTLYLQTARFNSDSDIADPDKVGRWLDATSRAGIEVVGWYLPAYSEHLQKDIRRTLAIADFRSPSGVRFDGLAVDIEYKRETSSADEFNTGIKEHLDGVRAGVGSSYPLASIVPAPLGMAIRPTHWTNFPWSHIGRRSDVVMPMGYWSYRDDCPEVREHCPYEYTRGNIAEARKMTGRPVHIIGGVGNNVTSDEIRDFVKGAADGDAIGGSVYDFKTTPSSSWTHLRGLS